MKCWLNDDHTHTQNVKRFIGFYFKCNKTVVINIKFPITILFIVSRCRVVNTLKKLTNFPVIHSNSVHSRTDHIDHLQSTGTVQIHSLYLFISVSTNIMQISTRICMKRITHQFCCLQICPLYTNKSLFIDRQEICL